MYIISPKQKEKENSRKMPELKLLPGGKRPSDPTNWISELDIGSMFLVKKKASMLEFQLGLFKLSEKTDKYAIIIHTSSPTEPLFIDPIRFCSVYSLVDVLGIIAPEYPKEEEDTKDTKEEEVSLVDLTKKDTS